MEEKKKSALGNEKSSHDLLDKLKMKDSDIKVCLLVLLCFFPKKLFNIFYFCKIFNKLIKFGAENTW